MMIQIQAFSRRPRSHNNRGDTIVEVLLSVTIIAFVLGAAYSLAQRSLQNGIAARERTEAVNLMQGQVERLKSVRKTIGVDAFSNKFRKTGPKFALDQNTNYVDVASSAYTAGTDNRYSLSVVCDKDCNNTGKGSTFHFSVAWNRVGGSKSGSQESADIYYRL